MLKINKMKNQFIISIAAIFLLASCGKKTQETKPIRKDVIETVFASGILEAKNTYTLKAQADGYLTAINFEEGNIVNAGKILAIVDNKESGLNQESARELYTIAQNNAQNNAPALQQAQNSIQINKTKMEQDFVQYQRYQKLWESNSVAKIDYENAELQYKTSRANYDSALENYKQLKIQANQQVISNKVAKDVNSVVSSRNQIKAVKSGKIFKKYKQIGDYVTRGEAIALIGEPTNIYAKVNIDESNIGKVKIGQEALIQLNTNNGKTYKATVAEIYPTFDEATQSFICKLTFNEPLDFTIVNTQLQSNIVVGTTKNALLIPRNYVDFGGNVQIKDQKEKTKVVTKFASSNWVQVLSGISDNTVLVTENLAANNVATSEVGGAMMK
jgi:multidrug efflux pump subunit AcrA (membrane-fusion protein)